jgi:hypothetical protein
MAGLGAPRDFVACKRIKMHSNQHCDLDEGLQVRRADSSKRDRLTLRIANGRFCRCVDKSLCPSAFSFGSANHSDSYSRLVRLTLGGSVHCWVRVTQGKRNEVSSGGFLGAPRTRPERCAKFERLAAKVVDRVDPDCAKTIARREDTRQL